MKAARFRDYNPLDRRSHCPRQIWLNSCFPSLALTNGGDQKVQGD